MKKILIAIAIILLNQVTKGQVNPADIKIARDSWGVPHIFGNTDADVAYGLAWAHAEDDFKTIQITLLAGKQMLGSHLGKQGAAADYIVGLIRARKQAQEHFTDLSPAYQKVLRAYVAGLNAYARAFPAEVLVKNSFPVTEYDALAGAILSISVFSGLDRTVKQILGDKIPEIPQKAEGSNAFALNSKKTKDGNTYLNINSHQPFEGPQAWYEAHLVSNEGWNCLGGLFPGGTSVFLGVNENLGWSHTVNHHDKMDVYQLQLNPSNKLQYKFDGQWLNLEEEKVSLKVKGLPIAIKKKVWWSKYGPTLFTKSGKAYAMRYAALFEVRSLEQWYHMNKAQNFSQFKAAMEMTAIPGFNTIYADKADTIFYVSNGKIPFRNKNYNWATTLPGDTSATLWQSFHPFAHLPQVLNPSSGYVFNTNNTPYNASAAADNVLKQNYDPTMGIEEIENNRSMRFMELIAQFDRLSYDDFKRIKYDVQYPAKFAFPLDLNEIGNIKAGDYPELSSMINNLQSWDRQGLPDSKGAAIFAMLYYYSRMHYAPEQPNSKKMSQAEIINGLQFVKKYFSTHFNNTEPSLGQLLQLKRGNVSLPVPGMPDVLAAMYGEKQKDGTFKAVVGDSYISLVQFSKNQLPIIETVINYGASSHANSPHYTDQMPLFVAQKTKKMTLDKNEVLKTAKKIYAPK